jgi:hypothetical protein
MHRIFIFITTAAAVALCAVPASAAVVPDTTTDDFCIAVQQILAKTEVPSELTVYPDMASFRQSKPTPRPLTNSQVVTLDEQGRPKMLSCKVKAADHIRAEYGEDAAGEQGYCREITVAVHENVVRKLQATDPAVAQTVSEFVIEPDAPLATGRAYLAPYPLAFEGDDGKLHINTQSLQVDWDDPKWWIMPYVLRGQTYCHIITPEHLEALARNEAEPDDPADFAAPPSGRP